MVDGVEVADLGVPGGDGLDVLGSVLEALLPVVAPDPNGAGDQAVRPAFACGRVCGECDGRKGRNGEETCVE